MLEHELTPECRSIFRQSAALAKLGVFVVDLASGRCLYCSEELARLLGVRDRGLHGADRRRRLCRADPPRRPRTLPLGLDGGARPRRPLPGRLPHSRRRRRPPASARDGRAGGARCRRASGRLRAGRERGEAGRAAHRRAAARQGGGRSRRAGGPREQPAFRGGGRGADGRARDLRRRRPSRLSQPPLSAARPAIVRRGARDRQELLRDRRGGDRRRRDLPPRDGRGLRRAAARPSSRRHPRAGVPHHRRPLGARAREHGRGRRPRAADQRHHRAARGDQRARGARAAPAADRRRRAAADRDRADQSARDPVRQRERGRDLRPAGRPPARGDPRRLCRPGGPPAAARPLAAGRPRRGFSGAAAARRRQHHVGSDVRPDHRGRGRAGGADDRRRHQRSQGVGGRARAERAAASCRGRRRPAGRHDRAHRPGGDPVRQRARIGEPGAATRRSDRQDPRRLCPAGGEAAAGGAARADRTGRRPRGADAAPRRQPDVGAGLRPADHLPRRAGDAHRGDRDHRSQGHAGCAARQRGAPRRVHGACAGRHVPEGPGRPLRPGEPRDEQGLRTAGAGDDRTYPGRCACRARPRMRRAPRPRSGGGRPRRGRRGAHPRPGRLRLEHGDPLSDPRGRRQHRPDRRLPRRHHAAKARPGGAARQRGAGSARS